MKNNHSSKATGRNFATTIGVLVIVGVFALAIGLALFLQNQEHSRQRIWPFGVILTTGVDNELFYLQSGYGRV